MKQTGVWIGFCTSIMYTKCTLYEVSGVPVGLLSDLLPRFDRDRSTTSVMTYIYMVSWALLLCNRFVLRS